MGDWLTFQPSGTCEHCSATTESRSETFRIPSGESKRLSYVANPDETNPDRYRASRWVPRSWEWVDPQREVDAYKTAVRCGFKTLGQVIAEQGGDLEDVLVARQAELAMLDEMDIVTDTDPSEVTEGGAVQAPLGMGAVPAFEETEAPVEEEEHEELSLLEDPTEAPED